MPHEHRVIFIYDCDIFTQEYNKHVLGRAIPLEQIDRARAEAPTDLYIDHVAAQRRQENVLLLRVMLRRSSAKSRARQNMKKSQSVIAFGLGCWQKF